MVFYDLLKQQNRFSGHRMEMKKKKNPPWDSAAWQSDYPAAREDAQSL